jgi:2-polyprenyl-3-methyl-5-hydroxy-6-metoxy-1,4-benzoquinol methylase
MSTFEKSKTAIGHVLAEPRPTQDELDRFYREQYYGQGVSATYHTQYTRDELAQKQLRAAVTSEAIAQALDGEKQITFLEIGAGEGFLLAAAQQRGWICSGIDFQRAPVEKFNPAALPVFTEAHPGEFLDGLVARKEKFSVVALQNVLEHALEPDVLMQGIRQILKPDGLFFVQVPNDFSRLQAAAKQRGLIEREYWFLPPQHLNYFNTDSLEAYAHANGFSIVDTFGDFPIEFYLWGNEENYTRNTTMGPLAHTARVELDLLMAEAGICRYLAFYRALSGVGMGRNICALMRPS